MRQKVFKIFQGGARFLFITAMIVLMNGCDSGHAKTGVDTTDSGIINISVDETFKPVIDSEIKVFEAIYPKAKIIAHYKPEADCLKDLVKDSATRLVIVTRGLTDDEELFFRDSIKYIPYFDKVANDAVAVIVNNNSADSFITMDKIRGILSGTSGDNEKAVFDGSNATSTVRYATDSILHGKPLSKNNVMAVENSEAVIDYVQHHNNVIGFVGVSWIGNKQDSTELSFLKKVKIASVQCIACGDDIYVKPYQANIMYKRYPLIRGLYYILKENYDGLGSGFTSFLSQEKGQLIFRRAYLGRQKLILYLGMLPLINNSTTKSDINEQIKIRFLLLTAIVYGSASMAQSLDDGKKFFFYERYTSAKNVFSQLVAANANNTDAVYWLGQAEIALGDSDDAKKLYQNALMSNSGSAILLAGMGHIELLFGQTQDARQRFETAISLSNGKSIPVLNAIGFANVDAPQGDPNYAIDKLKQATTLKGFKDPDVYINLGDAYKKILDGGNAQTAYESALALNPNYARASYKIGNIYITQGPAQEDVFMRYYNDAIAKDATFGPTYYVLYDYYYHRDVNKSRDYLNKYIANSDPDPKDCYYLASILYASGLFQQCITQADQCITSGGANPYPNLYGLKAYAYYKLNDSANAKTYFDEYFAKQKPSKIGPTDYSTYAKILLKTPGSDSLAGTYIDKAIALDTTESDKITDAKVLLDYYSQQKNFNGVGNAYMKIIAFRKLPVGSDFQSAGFNYYKGGNFVKSAAVFDSATKVFPNNIYDYYMMGKSQWNIDSTMQQGLANPAFDSVIQLGMADTAKNKAQLIGSYKYFVGYYINIKKDKATALDYCDKILALDPGDSDALAYKDAINKMKH